MRRMLKWAVGAFILMLVGTCFLVSSGVKKAREASGLNRTDARQQEEQENRSARRSAVKIGKQAVLANPYGANVAVAKSKESYQTFFKSLASKDSTGAVGSALAGAVFFVKNSDQIAALVLETGGMSMGMPLLMRIRILTGQFAGEEGWVQMDHLEVVKE